GGGGGAVLVRAPTVRVKVNRLAVLVPAARSRATRVTDAGLPAKRGSYWRVVPGGRGARGASISTSGRSRWGGGAVCNTWRRVLPKRDVHVRLKRCLGCLKKLLLKYCIVLHYIQWFLVINTQHVWTVICDTNGCN
uniref:Uncharacterized protein n=1 Tax=Oryza brachyantha TaxID=4533 RepID=J3ND80_ORYBR